MIHGREPKNVYLLLAQVAAWNSLDRRAAFARILVAGKVAGQRQLLQRRALDRGSVACAAAVQRLGEIEARALAAASNDVESLRGLEGAASAAYFGAFGDMLDPPWCFTSRVRRPPTDPVNALLGFGYALATGEVVRHLIAAGFDTRVGLLHGLRYGRESLALDLVEELRAPMVDRFVLRMLNRRVLAPDDFEERDGGAVRMSDAARRRFLELWEEMLAARAPSLRNERVDDGEAEAPTATRIARAASDPGAGEAGTITWRHRIERQVNRLRAFLLREVPFRPLQATRKTPRRASDEGAPSQRADPGSQPDGTIDKPKDS